MERLATIYFYNLFTISHGLNTLHNITNFTCDITYILALHPGPRLSPHFSAGEEPGYEATRYEVQPGIFIEFNTV